MQKRTVHILFLFVYHICIGQNLSENSTGSFTYTPQPPIDRPPVEVFYRIPQGDISTMPILMSFHGSARNGDDFRDYWINMANDNGFMVFAPEFSSANYPGLGDNYIMSNIFVDGDNPSPETFNDRNEWTCSILDPLFDYIKDDVSGSQENYSTWGHSAGAQFLHRLFMYLPNSKINVAVCSNAGWYTVPEQSVTFPYGLNESQLPESDLITSFSNNLIIHLGQDDTIPSTAPGGPRDNPILNNQQGFHRLERGQYFFNTSQSTAQNLDAPFVWQKQEVPNIGHDAQIMANDALQYLLPFLLSTETQEETFFSLYPNPTNTGFIEIKTRSRELITAEVFNLLGKKVKEISILPNTRLNLLPLSSGMYIVKMNQKDKFITKKLIIE